MGRRNHQGGGDKQVAAYVAQPPHTPDRAEVLEGDGVADQQARHADGGGDGGAGHRREYEDKHVPESLERGPKPDPAQQVGARDTLERIAAGNPEHRDERHARPGVGEQRPQRDARPDPVPPQDERCQRDPGRRPDGGDAGGRKGEMQAELGRPVVGGGDQRELRGVDAPALVAHRASEAGPARGCAGFLPTPEDHDANLLSVCTL